MAPFFQLLTPTGFCKKLGVVILEKFKRALAALFITGIRTF